VVYGELRTGTQPRGVDMTETLDAVTIDELKAIIDRGLGTTKSRELMATSEVADLLLDLRLLLATTETDIEADIEASPLN